MSVGRPRANAPGPRLDDDYQRVVAAVWSRYRQEWAFGRRSRDFASIPKQAEPGPAHPDAELIGRLASALDALPEADRRLIVQLFWEGRSEQELAAALGISQQGVNKRKGRIVGKLRSLLGTPA
jgi:RNA polymerase sigma factor (sigma-70 family)